MRRHHSELLERLPFVLCACVSSNIRHRYNDIGNPKNPMAEFAPHLSGCRDACSSATETILAENYFKSVMAKLSVDKGEIGGMPPGDSGKVSVTAKFNFEKVSGAVLFLGQFSTTSTTYR